MPNSKLLPNRETRYTLDATLGEQNVMNIKEKYKCDITESDVRTATVVSTHRITSLEDPVEVRHIVLKPSEDDLRYLEGQTIAVLVRLPRSSETPYHLRLYSIASSRRGEGGNAGTFSICVRRCFLIDEKSGKLHPGLASNYLCNVAPGDPVLYAGPYGSHFLIPIDTSSNLVMIGAGTGIAPFRAFVKRIYDERGGWTGEVRLFYGATNGMELFYRNDVNKDLSLYYDESSFKAFEAVCDGPCFESTEDLQRVLSENSQEIWQLLRKPNTYVYVAGHSSAAKNFRKAMIPAAGSETVWQTEYEKLVQQRRYAELLYE